MINILRLLLLLPAITQALVGCASLPDRSTESPAAAADVSSSTLYSIVTALEQQYPNQSGFYALSDGIDALAARLMLIDRAEVTLDVQYYIWHDDLVGKAMHNHLLHAADRGVKVRLLLDDLDTAGKDALLARLQYHPNIDIRLFNPFPNRTARWWDFLANAKRLNHRMHNKSITADHSISILGGRNIGNEYFNASEEVGFNDMDVVAMGPVADEVTQAFDLFWRSEWAFPLQQIVKDETVTLNDYQQYRQASDEFIEQEKQGAYSEALSHHAQQILYNLTLENISWGRWLFWRDSPAKVMAEQVDRDNFMVTHLWDTMAKAQQQMIIVSPYFVPGDKFSDFLIDKVASGVQVQVLTNSLAANDVPLVYAGYRNYRERLLKGGVELYEFKPIADSSSQHTRQLTWKGSSKASLHGKYIGIDQRYMFVGSFNLDPRSAIINTELGVFFESPSYARELDRAFSEQAMLKAYRVELDEDNNLQWQTLENNQLTTYKKAPQTSGWQRFMSRFMSVVVPESAL